MNSSMQESPGLKPVRLGEIKLFWYKKLNISLNIIFSNILPQIGKSELDDNFCKHGLSPFL